MRFSCCFHRIALLYERSSFPEGKSEPFIRNCFVLGTCGAVIGSDVIECTSEKELLEKWAESVIIAFVDVKKLRSIDFISK